MGRTAILIDGSNFLAELDRCGLGYPALAPLIAWIQGPDDLVYARFYSAPQSLEPFRGRWQSFRSANRHVPALQFFQGYRDNENREKVIDVALAVDLIYGAAFNHFDRVAIIGGDSDHHYAFSVAKSMLPRGALKVYLMPAQPSRALASKRIAFRYFTVQEMLERGIADRGSQGLVPTLFSAPRGEKDVTLRLTGSFGDPA